LENRLWNRRLGPEPDYQREQQDFSTAGTMRSAFRSLASDTPKERNLKMTRIGKAVLVVALGMTVPMATGAWAQTGRDGAQSGSGTMNQKGGSMGQKGNTMQHNNMEKGSSGTMSK
jgi:hypothetical protein